MRTHPRLTVAAGLAVYGLTGLVGAPTAAADCNASSGTTVCAQGDIRGTHAPPPAPSSNFPFYGSFCTGICLGGRGGFGIVLGP